MPLHDLSLDLTSPGRAVAGAPASAAPPLLEVMTRALRLPTLSKRQARSIVRMQLDRLSPLPVPEIVFDIVLVRPEGAEGLWALGLARKAALRDPALAATAVVSVAKSVEGAEVLFRFRNRSAVSDQETRWLKHAPTAALIAAGLAAAALAGNIRSDLWRERRLPEIAEAARVQARLARDARQERDARTEWTGLQRADASTRLICILSRLEAKAPGGMPITRLSATPQAVTLQTPLDADVAALTPALTSAGATVSPTAAVGTGAGTEIVFRGGTCG